ncbi:MULTISPECIES: hypothetical protein [unclassified Arenibacter]|uniref:hypothetical protein n=1 Tax=unclassified Arenibacter TaxID=2615047 RepID=UPI000E344888|nr:MULTISPECIES: hypothetical protein [unclassified Arenibacter]MCM4162759.1 hypothetical protein [Arenibacter sp. A80]RFT56812.1 hypothetical protein D0S24_04055 [Arenibacter sp. P308M17]
MSENEKIMRNVFGTNLWVLKSKKRAMVFPLFTGFNKEYEIINIMPEKELTKTVFTLAQIGDEIFFKNLRNDEILIFDINRIESRKIRLESQSGRYAEFDMTELERTDDLQHYLD